MDIAHYIDFSGEILKSVDLDASLMRAPSDSNPLIIWIPIQRNAVQSASTLSRRQCSLFMKMRPTDDHKVGGVKLDAPQDERYSENIKWQMRAMVQHCGLDIYVKYKT
jgi:hypothetical protein